MEGYQIFIMKTIRKATNLTYAVSITLLLHESTMNSAKTLSLAVSYKILKEISRAFARLLHIWHFPNF